MATKKKFLQAAAGTAAASSGGGGGTAGPMIEDLFSTYVYEGNSGNNVIETGISLSQSYGSGGSVEINDGYDWINIPASSDFGYGTGDFTIELFLWLHSHKNWNEIWDQRTANESASTTAPIIYSDSAGYLYFFHSGVNRITYSTSLPLAQWNHIAVSKSGSSTKMFVNGTQVGSTYSDSTNYITPTAGWSIGAAAEQNGYAVNGYVSNARAIKGSGIYTSNFTVPTAELTAVTNTVLLTAQGDSPFTDNSNSAHSLTANGSAKSSNFGPFDAATSSDGGMIWMKTRDAVQDHNIFDTERGAFYRIKPNLTNAQNYQSNGLSEFTSNGWVMGSSGNINNSSRDFVSWSFKKAQKFFDVVTFTNTTGNDENVSHSLGVAPGMIIGKRTDTTSDWMVWHVGTSMSNGGYTGLSLNNNASAFFTSVQSDQGITSTQFNTGYVLSHDGAGGYTKANVNGGTYVFYLFANNDGDASFGPTGDQDVIKCGTFTASAGTEIDLGFEPQWVMTKSTTSADDWYMFDVMRDWGADQGSSDQWLYANSDAAELTATNSLGITPTGFTSFNGGGETYIYIAIRRGLMAAPTDATKVFKTSVPQYNQGDSPVPYWQSNFPVDMFIHRHNAGSSGISHLVFDRLRGDAKALVPNNSDAEGAGTHSTFTNGVQQDHSEGIHSTVGYGAGSGSEDMLHMWRRAPKFFDMVAYSGSQPSNFNVDHNLQVAPELVITKGRSATSNWGVYTTVLGNNTNWLQLNSTNAVGAGTSFMYVTDTQLQIANNSFANAAGSMIAYLFASLSGVSKVGSFTHTNGTATNVDCGFSNSARFVLLKRTNATGNWVYMNSERGIVSGNDPYLALNTTDAEVTNSDVIDPYSAGFTVASGFLASGTWLFYAVA